MVTSSSSRARALEAGGDSREIALTVSFEEKGRAAAGGLGLRGCVGGPGSMDLFAGGAAGAAQAGRDAGHPSHPSPGCREERYNAPEAGAA